MTSTQKALGCMSKIALAETRDGHHAEHNLERDLRSITFTDPSHIEVHPPRHIVSSCSLTTTVIPHIIASRIQIHVACQCRAACWWCEHFLGASRFCILTAEFKSVWVVSCESLMNVLLVKSQGAECLT